MTYLDKKYEGHSPHRLADNPLEKRFARRFQAHCKEGRRGYYDPDLIDHMVGDGQKPGEASPEERKMACTVAQWLGSPVGFGWLMDTLGFKDLRTEQELKFAIGVWRDRKAHWEQQHRLAEAGGHGPGSDF